MNFRFFKKRTHQSILPILAVEIGLSRNMKDNVLLMPSDPTALPRRRDAITGWTSKGRSNTNSERVSSLYSPVFGTVALQSSNNV